MIPIYVVQYKDGTLATYIDPRCAVSEVLADYKSWLERHPEVTSVFADAEFQDIWQAASFLISERGRVYMEDFATISYVPLSDVFDEEDLLDLAGPGEGLLN